jgi:hypothetical protein
LIIDDCDVILAHKNRDVGARADIAVDEKQVTGTHPPFIVGEESSVLQDKAQTPAVRRKLLCECDKKVRD